MCEVKYVAKHNGAWIKDYLDGVQKLRGHDAYKKLRGDVLEVWKK